MDNISSDSLQTIFTYLDVGEISRKCLTNHLFDKVCRSDFFWENILKRNYSVVEKEDDHTWRNKTKEMYLESTTFWNTIDNNIEYYMWDFCFEDEVDEFQKSLTDRALREKKEFIVMKLIFYVFLNTFYSEDNIRRMHFCRNFISLFEKVASLSPQKRISIKWILSLTDKVDIDKYGKCHPKIVWRIEILAAIYLKYEHLFIVDVDSVDERVKLIKQDSYRLSSNTSNYASLCNAYILANF
uniref:F-box-like family protein n=1 Tax=Pithovirus LCPAC401 TaxID=2506595 RepID=A0A481ZCG7_9VIRU|nr:MAG: F-box-like family protein [Pithovirus LCPAC401]